MVEKYLLYNSTLKHKVGHWWARNKPEGQSLHALAFEYSNNANFVVIQQTIIISQ